MTNTTIPTTQLSIEVVRYALNNGISTDSYKESSNQLNNELQPVDGFFKRDVYFNEEQRLWLDIVLWESVDVAKAAEEHLMKNGKAKSFFNAINPLTVKMNHFTPVLECGEKSQNSVIELVIFEIDTTFSEDKIMAKSERIHPTLQSFDGFQKRIMGKSADGKWMDLVYWDSLEQAQQASEKVMSSPICLDYFGVIKQDSMEFMHFV